MTVHECRDCNTTESWRRRVAQAGRGLPGIEAGMPLPAGTGLTRRDFVSRSAGLALGIYGGAALSARAFEEGIANAASTPAQNVLVVVYLSGGIDSLSVLFPAGDPLYYQLRPNIAIAQSAGSAFSQDARLRWHPTANGLATLHGEGKVSVIPAIGYVNNDESHFTSRHYWEVGAPDATLRTGWLGRYLDSVGTLDNPIQGLSLDTALQPALASKKMPVATLQAADQYTFAPPGLPAHPLEQSMLQEAANIGAAHATSPDPGLAAAGSIALESHHSTRSSGR
jgi:uncharacterized protein (DUF1501 family)